MDQTSTMNSDADIPAAAHYNDSNRAFVQVFMAQGTMTFEEAKQVLATIFSVEDPSKPTLPEDVTIEDFKSYLSAASDALSPFDYEIRSGVHQVSKERVWALVNSTSDGATQLATTRTAEEMAYIKRVLDAMFETYNTPRAEIMGVTSLQALKVAKGGSGRSSLGGGGNGDGEASQQPAPADKGLSTSQAERLLASLVAEGWLERSREGWYTLSARALLELRAWLVVTYNEPDADEDEWQRIKNCEACRAIVTVGERCANQDCNVRLHDICQASYWKTQSARACPRCRTEWSGRNWVGERAVTTTEAYNRGKRRSGAEADRGGG
ncbi:MAG: hypothetical protein M1818_007965 [Claussenomyces sp. TS43310]|nr:MAG: hypothetical protein M1818_007965 [Claussenomyces sp. TS43310]